MLATLEIDLAAMQANVTRLRELVAPARFAAVLKANAYGHGLVETARALEDHADLFCVYHPEEALALRESRIRTPLLVLGPVEGRLLRALHEAGAAITLWDAGHYRDYVGSVARDEQRPFPVHVKVETGVGRYGFKPEAAAAAIGGLLSDADFEVEGAFTHLAAAEELESAFTAEQGAHFAAAVEPVREELRSRGAGLHAAASAAAMLYPALRFDLVRCGIAVYGLWPSAATRRAAAQPDLLTPALRWTSSLVSLRDVDAGSPVGYGCTFTTGRPSTIGVVPLGYAEGVPRAASNAGAVLVDGVRAPIVGRVCMNATLVDVTDVPAAHPGSRVVLIGSENGETIGADDWAEWCGTINYEIVARLPAEVPRSYVPSSPTKALVRAVR
jgi:alanine racemase